MTVAKSIIHARNAALYIHSASSTFAENTSLDQDATILTTDNIFAVKNLTISPPKGEAETITMSGESGKTVGAGNLTTNTFQNQVFELKAWGAAKITGTVLFQHDELGNSTTPGGTIKSSLQGLISGAGTDVTSVGNFTRYDFGGSASGKARDTANGLIFVFNNGSGIVNMGIVNAIANLGDIKMTGADGHWEQDFELTCLAEDIVIELQD